jgi:hypothetical protein
MPQVREDVRVRLNEGDELLLLLQDLLEVLKVVLWVFLLLEFLDDFNL